ncbi:MAG TPA: RDD family protein [Candidatus Nitrosotenuis sp.]|jgi:uncharacterized RDD family membrane protein YckC|nr:RDD family protein [Candidatus Nitrosotenuis sp.]
MPARVVILTPENVRLEYPLAGLGSRFLAMMLDFSLQFLLFVLLLAGSLGAAVVLGMTLEGASPWVYAAFALGAFAISQGYFVLFEWLWNGQTPGKRLAGLRVMLEGGHPVDFRTSLIRNVMRLVDFLPGAYATGALFIFFHRRCQRVGDLAAGTLVVREPRNEGPAGFTWLVRPGPDGASPLPLHLLSQAHLELVEQFLRRRQQLDLPLRGQLAWEIAVRLRRQMGLEDAAGDPESFLEEVLAARVRQAGL